MSIKRSFLKNIIGYVLLLTFMSCIGETSVNSSTFSKQNPNLYSIDLRGLSLKDTILDNVEFIPLETTEKSLIANIGKVLSFDNNFYILDDKFNQVHIFDENGGFRQSIGAIGQAPGEYLSVEDICFDADTTAILLLSNNSKKILKYSLMGTHIKDYSFDVFGSKLVVDSSNFKYVYIDKNESRSSENFDLLRLDSTSKIITKYFMFEDKDDFGVSFAGFLKIGRVGDVLFNNAFTDTVYSINGSYVSAKYAFNIENQKINLPTNKQITEKLTNGENYNFLSTVFEEIPSGIVFSYHSDKVVYTIYENLQNKRKNRLSFPLHNIVGKDDGENLFASIFPLVKENNKNDDFFLRALENYPKLKTSLENIDPEDNPILVRFSIN